MAEMDSASHLIDIATTTYDALPKIAEAFLQRAADAGLAFDIEELRHHSKITFPSATVIFRWCEPSHTSHGIGVHSPQRSFELWFEVRGWVSLKEEDTQLYSQRLLKTHGYGDDEFLGDHAAFENTARFVSGLSPDAFGIPQNIEKW